MQKRMKMKTRSLFPTIVLLASALCSCSQETTEDAALPQGVRVSFRGDYTPAVDANPTSRVAVDPATGKTAWTAGDRCGVWVAENSVDNVPFTNTTDETDLFSGTLDANIASAEPVWAYYPFTAATSVGSAPRSMTVPVPTSQIQQGGQLGANSLLTASGALSADAAGQPKITAMHFIHRTAGLSFNIYGSLRIASPNPETLQAVTIHTLDAVPSAITVTDPSDPAATVAYSQEKAMTVTVENAPAAIGYVKADGTKAFLSVLCDAPYRIASITVMTDQALYTKDFTALPGGCKTIDPSAGQIYPINLDLATFTAVQNYTLGVPGEHNSWNAAEGITGRTSGFFSGMVSFAGKYKYNKDGTWYGPGGGEPFTLYYTLASPGGDFTITGDFYVIADIVGLNASLVQSVTLPGSMNSWSLETAPAFVYDAGRDLWTASGVTLSAGDEFKIVFNNSWLTNMNRSIAGGGTVQPNTPVHVVYEPTFNMVAGQSGTFDLTLDLSTYGGTLLLQPVAAQ